MDYIDLSAPQRAMYMAMFNRRRVDSGIDISRELDRQADEDRRDLAEKRLETESTARQQALQDRVEIERQRAAGYLSAEQAREAQERAQVQLGQERGAREERELTERIPLWRAQTGEAQAGTTAALARAKASEAEALKNRVEALGLSDKNAREVADGLVKDSQRIANQYIGMAQGGQPIDKNGTDAFVAAMRHLNNNRFYDVPRNDDGGWKYDPKLIDQQFPMTDSKGMPTWRAAQDHEKLTGPISDFGRKLHDARAILDDPTQSDDMKHAAMDELINVSAPAMPKVQGDMAERLVQIGAYPEAINLMKDFQNKGDQKLKMPSAAAQTDLTNRISIVGTQNELMDRWQKLKEKGLVPVGTWSKPVRDLLKDIGANNEEVQTFNDLLNAQVSQYMTLQHGRRYMEKEMEFILNTMPSQYDSPATFEYILKAMRQHMVQDINERAGTLQDWGFQIPKGLNPIPVMQTLREGRLPAALDFNDGGHLTTEAIRDHAIGLDKLRQQYQRSGQNIGGVGSFRDNMPEQGIGMSYSPTEPVAGDDEAKMRDEISKMSPEEIRKELRKGRPNIPDLSESENDPADLQGARKEALDLANQP